MRQIVVSLVLAALVAAPFVPVANAGVTTFSAMIDSFDGHKVPVTIYLAAEGPAPTLLWGHGWAGNKGSSTNTGTFFAENGYNVVAMDFRGHGEARSTSKARVHDVDVEIRDVSAVISWIAVQEWALLDRPGDPVLGALGGSYGGGYQLLTAAFDWRLDAIAPEITWSSLPQSLAPNGGIRSAWVDLLYAGGVASANLDDIIHQGYAWAMTTNDFPDGSLPGEPDIVSLFVKNSPSSYYIYQPTFLIQGTSDTLFNYNQAIANMENILAAQHAAGIPQKVKLMTHLGGHIVSTAGTVPGGFPPATGLQAPSAPSPCGSINEAVLAWYDHVLKGAPDTLPDVQQALDDGTCFVGVADNVKSASLGTLAVPQGAPLASGHPFVGGQALDVPALRVPVGQFAEGQIVAGIPKLTAQAIVAGGDAIVYFSIVKVDALGRGGIVNDQVMPMRFGVGVHEFEVDLGGIGTRVGPGESLALQVSSFDPQFAHNGARLPGAVVLQDVNLQLALG